MPYPTEEKMRDSRHGGARLSLPHRSALGDARLSSATTAHISSFLHHPLGAVVGNAHEPTLCVASLVRSSTSTQKQKSPEYKLKALLLAEKERFELSNPVTGYTISNRAPSTS